MCGYVDRSFLRRPKGIWRKTARITGVIEKGDLDSGAPWGAVGVRYLVGETLMFGVLLIFVLLIALAVCVPNCWQRRRWGFIPSTVAGVLLVVAVTLVFTDQL